MTMLVADAIQEYVARQDLTPIADQIAVSERRIARYLRSRLAPAPDVRRP
jgi:hypothetical protein